jgi:hypothetical protein
MKLKWQT